MLAASFTGAYSQDFDSLPTSGTSLPWTNNVTLPGWHLFRQPAPGSVITSLKVANVSAINDGFYSFGQFGVGSSLDRALGGIGGGSAYFDGPAIDEVAGWIALGLTNATGATIPSVQLSYTGEQWLDAFETVQTMELEYGIGADFASVSTWTSTGAAFDFTSPVHSPFPSFNVPLDGNRPEHRTEGIGGTLEGLNWTPGSTLWVRWVERNDDGPDHGLAIDDVLITTTDTLSKTLIVDSFGEVIDGDYGSGKLTLAEAAELAALPGSIVETIRFSAAFDGGEPIIIPGSALEFLNAGSVELVLPASPIVQDQAIFTWTSPANGVVTLGGSMWEVAASNSDHNWSIEVDSQVITSGTLLDGQYPVGSPLSIAFGSGGPGAVQNIPVSAGATVRLLASGGSASDVDADVTAIFHADSAPHYELGALPTKFQFDGAPLEFVIDRPAGWAGPLTMQATPAPAGAIEFNASTGRFRYSPAVDDKFAFNVLFQIGDGGSWDAPTYQLVTISPADVLPEVSLVASPRPLPDPASRDYITVSETINTLPAGSYFNAAPRTTTRNVEVSGKTIVIAPGHPNGLYERIAYADPTGQSVVNSDIQSLAIYAERVVIGAPLRLPQTDVTIYAKTLEFVDSPGIVASIATTPLGYRLGAAQFANGLHGEDAGDIHLYVESIIEPAASTIKRFILHGGKGQEAGAGKAGDPGPIMQVFVLADAPHQQFVYIDMSQWPGGFPNRGTQAWPDGEDAIPGGRPGNGGDGGHLHIYGNPLRINSISGMSAGLPGDSAASQPGGDPGTPTNALWGVQVPGPDGFRTYLIVATHTAQPGKPWTADEDGYEGDPGSLHLHSTGPNNWLHSAAQLAMVSYAKDVYINGHVELAARMFGEYQQLLDAVPPEAAAHFSELRSKVAMYAHRAANGLDYFGNPAGWVPSLSFAANFLAFENEIDNDIRLLYLTRLIQQAGANQDVAADALTKSLENLDADVARASAAFNDAQALLPQLQAQLDAINQRTDVIEQLLMQREQELRQQAEDNLRPPFWKQALEILSSVLSIVPGVGAIGTAIGGVSSFLSAPSLGGLGQAFSGVGNAFSKQKLDAAAAEFAAQENLLTPPSEATFENLGKYAEDLGKLYEKWAPVVNAATSATQATQVPMSKLEAELNRLKAQDSRFNDLIAQIMELNAQKEAFSQGLARATQTISEAIDDVTAGYASAAIFTSQLNDIQGGLRHDTLDHVKQLERAASERLLRYQYYMAKAYEYELLAPYRGSFQLDNLADAITGLLASSNPDLLDNETQLNALKSAYEAEVAEIADQIWTTLNMNAPQRTSEIAPRLSPAQLAELNTRGEVTINLVELGFIPANRQGVKLLEIGVKDITASNPGPFALLADVRFEFEHGGTSIVQSGGQKFLFQHRASDSSTPIFWATHYDAIGGGLTASEIHPSQIASIAALLGLNPASVSDDQANRFFAHPGAWADVTIRKIETFVPASIVVDVTDLQLLVRYESDQPQANTVLLDVRTNSDISPRIDISRLDKSGRGDGAGSFTRFFQQGESVTLTAEPTYGRLEFAGWRNAAGQIIGSIPALTLPLNQSTQAYATYAPIVDGDFDQDGDVDGRDFLLWQRGGSPNPLRAVDLSEWQNNYNVLEANPVAGDFDLDGDVDGRDFLAWQRNPNIGNLADWQEQYGEEEELSDVGSLLSVGEDWVPAFAGMTVRGQGSGIADLGLGNADYVVEFSPSPSLSPEYRGEGLRLDPRLRGNDGAGRGNDESENASDELSVFADRYIQEADRAFEQLGTVSASGGRGFGEMVAQRQLRRAALIDFAF